MWEKEKERRKRQKVNKQTLHKSNVIITFLSCFLSQFYMIWCIWIFFKTKTNILVEVPGQLSNDHKFYSGLLCWRIFTLLCWTIYQICTYSCTLPASILLSKIRTESNRYIDQRTFALSSSLTNHTHVWCIGFIHMLIRFTITSNSLINSSRLIFTFVFSPICLSFYWFLDTRSRANAIFIWITANIRITARKITMDIQPLCSLYWETVCSIYLFSMISFAIETEWMTR